MTDKYGAEDKGKGRIKEAVGTIKEKVGHAVGDRDLEARGIVQQGEGKKDRAKGEIKEKVEDAKATVRAGAEIIKDKLTGRDDRR